MFKHGDKVRCTKSFGVCVKGQIYTFHGYTNATLKYLRVKESMHMLWLCNDTSSFELVLTPHPHAELIKLWADNTDIKFQEFSKAVGWSFPTRGQFMNWRSDRQYRVYQEPKPNRVETWFINSHPLNGVELSRHTGLGVSLTFDGETDKVIDVKRI